MPEEIRVFLRGTLFALGITVVYWFVSYEVAGTLLLLGFGIAGAFIVATLVFELRRTGWRLSGRPWTWVGLAPVDEPTDLTHTEGRLPAASLAPLALGLSIAIAGLALVYGAWLVVAAAPLALVGASAWYREASAEHRALERSTRSEPVSRRS